MERFPSVVADIANELITISGEASIKEAAEVMLEHNIGSIIVVENGKPIGIVTKSDLLSRVLVKCRDPRECKAREVMSSPLISVKKDTPILEAMRTLKNRKVRRLLVCDGEKLVGIVSETDLVRAVTLTSLAQFSPLLRKK
ncbi:MAG TPA: CBS domain-containing protein [Candidatus Desulfaltia sp.]|nr:CBS domain-containing protein [Candidatus Desulfaltia sp.]